MLLFKHWCQLSWISALCGDLNSTHLIKDSSERNLSPFISANFYLEIPHTHTRLSSISPVTASGPIGPAAFLLTLREGPSFTATWSELNP